MTNKSNKREHATYCGNPMDDSHARCQGNYPPPPPPRPRASAIEHPPHYVHGGIEAIDVIEAWQLGFRLGNAVKYIARADHKGSRIEDLKKARWYLDREIANAERNG